MSSYQRCIFLKCFFAFLVFWTLIVLGILLMRETHVKLENVNAKTGKVFLIYFAPIVLMSYLIIYSTANTYDSAGIRSYLSSNTCCPVTPQSITLETFFAQTEEANEWLPKVYIQYRYGYEDDDDWTFRRTEIPSTRDIDYSPSVKALKSLENLNLVRVHTEFEIEMSASFNMKLNEEIEAGKKKLNDEFKDSLFASSKTLE